MVNSSCGSSATATIFRVGGSILLGVSLLNFLVRNQPMSETLRAVLWADFAIHTVGIIGDCWSANAGDIGWGGIGVVLIAHLIVLLGAAYYLWRPNAP